MLKILHYAMLVIRHFIHYYYCALQQRLNRKRHKWSPSLPYYEEVDLFEQYIAFYAGKIARLFQRKRSGYDAIRHYSGPVTIKFDGQVVTGNLIADTSHEKVVGELFGLPIVEGKTLFPHGDVSQNNLAQVGLQNILDAIECFQSGERKDWPARDIILEALYRQLPVAERDAAREKELLTK